MNVHVKAKIRYKAADRLVTPRAQCIRCAGRCVPPAGWRALWMLPCNRHSAQRRGTDSEPLRPDRLSF